jgi:hypothetical protein
MQVIETVEQRIERAATVREEGIDSFLHDPSPRVLKALLSNRLLTDEQVLVIANRRSLPGDVLEAIAKDGRWAGSYPIRMAIAKNPKTPLFVSLSLARHLRLFDLADITRDHFLPIPYRKKIEAMIIERIPAMPLGIKKTLARRAAGSVLFTLLLSRDTEIVQICLGNPHLMESHLFKYISRENSLPETIRMIAEHPNWSSRAAIRLSLARNAQMPLSSCIRFFSRMTAQDLRELYADPLVPVTVKPFIHRELWERGIEALPPTDDETVYEMEETDDLALGTLMFDQEGSSADAAQDTAREQDQ